METIGNWHKVKRLVWNTNKSGRLFPVIQFTKPFEMNGNVFDGLAFEPKTVTELGIGKGSHLRISKTEDSMLEVEEVKYKRESLEPKLCSTCHSSIVELKCSNFVCDAKGRTPMVKMLAYNEAISYEEAHNILEPYLDEFPYENATHKINDIIDFLHFVRPKMNPRTELRVSQLSKLKNHEKIHDFEVAVYSWFSIYKGKLAMPNDLFWDMLSLNGIPTEDYNALYGVSPVGYEGGFAEKLLKSGVSKKSINIILSVNDAITQVLSYAKIN